VLADSLCLSCQLQRGRHNENEEERVVNVIQIDKKVGADRACVMCNSVQQNQNKEEQGAIAVQTEKVGEGVLPSCMIRVGQNRIYTPYMTVYLVISLPKTPYIHRIYMVLANPMHDGCASIMQDGCVLSCEQQWLRWAKVRFCHA
jgi:hypothetical protein